MKKSDDDTPKPTKKNGHDRARERMDRDRVAVGKDSRGRVITQLRPGKPKAKIDVEILTAYAGVDATFEEMAAQLDVSIETLRTEPWMAHILRGREIGKLSLRRKLHMMAMGGDSRVLIHLSEVRLGMRRYGPWDRYDPEDAPAMPRLEIVFVDSDGDGRPRRYQSAEEMPDDVPQLPNGKP